MLRLLSGVMAKGGGTRPFIAKRATYSMAAADARPLPRPSRTSDARRTPNAHPRSIQRPRSGSGHPSRPRPGPIEEAPHPRHRRRRDVCIRGLRPPQTPRTPARDSTRATLAGTLRPDGQPRSGCRQASDAAIAATLLRRTWSPAIRPPWVQTTTAGTNSGHKQQTSGDGKRRAGGRARRAGGMAYRVRVPETREQDRPSAVCARA